jgi:tetratricopeptide (TPR) repeat protein
LEIQIRINLADLYFRRGELEKAYEELESLLPDWERIDPSFRADILIMKGRIRREVDPGEAKSLFEEAIDLYKKENSLEDLFEAHLEAGRLPDEVVGKEERLAHLVKAKGYLKKHLKRIPGTAEREYLSGESKLTLRREFRALKIESARGEFKKDWPGFLGAVETGEVGGIVAQKLKVDVKNMRRELRRLEGDKKRFQTLMMAGNQLNSLQPLDELIPLIVDRILEITGASRGFVMLLGEEGALEFKAARSAEGKAVQRAAFKISRSMVNQVLSSGQALLTSDAAMDERFKRRKSVLKLDLHSILIAPLKLKEKPIGVIRQGGSRPFAGSLRPGGHRHRQRQALL